MRLAITAVVAALGLAACGPSEPASDAASTTTPDAATPAPDAAPAASAPPTIEGPAAGKWRMTMTTMGQAMPSTEVCYEKRMTLAEAEKLQQRAGVTCSEQSFRREADGWVGHSVCSMDAGGQKMTMTTDTRVTGDFNTKYTLDMTSRMDPPPMPSMAEQKMIIEMERLGDC